MLSLSVARRTVSECLRLIPGAQLRIVTLAAPQVEAPAR